MSGPPINVIIPLGGLGSRFQKEGYLTRPKPFVRVLGKEMILWVVDNLSIRSDDGLVLVYNPSWMSMDAEAGLPMAKDDTCPGKTTRRVGSTAYMDVGMLQSVPGRKLFSAAPSRRRTKEKNE